VSAEAGGQGRGVRLGQAAPARDLMNASFDDVRDAPIGEAVTTDGSALVDRPEHRGAWLKVCHRYPGLYPANGDRHIGRGHDNGLGLVLGGLRADERQVQALPIEGEKALATPEALPIEPDEFGPAQGRGPS
jgi:hypothetical protein